MDLKASIYIKTTRYYQENLTGGTYVDLKVAQTEDSTEYSYKKYICFFTADVHKHIRLQL